MNMRLGAIRPIAIEVDQAGEWDDLVVAMVLLRRGVCVAVVVLELSLAVRTFKN